MRLLFCFCMLISSGIGWGQLQFALEANEVSFPPTTVDSTSTISLIVINELALPQEVSVSGIGLPFATLSESFTIPANDTLGLPALLHATEDGSYLHWTRIVMIAGNVFGNGHAGYVTGEGTLPVESLVGDRLSSDFETVSINSTHARGNLRLTNTGVGTLVIGAINSSSNAEFSAIRRSRDCRRRYGYVCQCGPSIHRAG